MSLRLSLLMFLQWTVPASLVPLYSSHLDQLGFSPLAIAACCATQSVAGVVASLLAGHVADRWVPAERALTVCAVVAGVELWLLAELRQPLAVFLTTLAFWLVTGPMMLMGTTVSFTHLGRPNRQFGPVRMWGTVGWMAVGWLTGAWLARAGSPPLEDAFRLGGVFAFLLAGYSLTLPHTPPQRLGEPGRRLAPAEALGLLRMRPFAIYCACVLGACITFPFTTQTTPLLLKQLGVAPGSLAAWLTLAQTTEVAFLALLPALLLRMGVRGTMVLGLTAWLAAMCVLAVGRPFELVVASLGLNGVYVTGFMIAGQVYVNELAADGVRASAQGLLSCVSGLGMLAGNLLAGWLREWSRGELPPTFGVAAAITSVILLVMVAGFRQPERVERG